MATMQKLPMKQSSQKCYPKCLIGTLLYIFILLFLLFVLIFVIIPVVFKYSPGLQRNIIFPSWIVTPKNYSDIESFNIKGVKNFYVDLENPENVTLGIWQILPEEILSDLVQNEDYNFDGILKESKYDTLIYLHGNGGDRASSIELYQKLRQRFHIFAIDYRGYADSTQADITVSGIVGDTVDFYKWLRNRTSAKIFVWGHSLGTGISTHALSRLKEDNVTAAGLILETPFTSVLDVMKVHPIVELITFFPWGKVTMLDPIVENDFNLDSGKHILDVDCPIMILHAKDDSVIPYQFGTQLYHNAMAYRNLTYQGNVTYHLFEAVGYDHMLIYKAPKLYQYVIEFVEECYRFAKKLK